MTMASASDVPSNHDDSLKKQRAKGRWTILRNALLQKASRESTAQHSIHRYPGYQLLKPCEDEDVELGVMQSYLKSFEFRSDISNEDNFYRLELAILALAACFPKGCCLDISGCSDPSTCIQSIKEKCQATVNLLVVENKTERLLLLVQEGSSAKYKARQYKLDDNCSLWTREPFGETRLSLKDLVSHRTTGVDNTGNICVWDSERTLAYLLHLQDFSVGQRRIKHILELGTGMAGLAAISLGLRLVQQNNPDEKIKIILTDGHAAGVKNNLVNQYLTKTYSTLKSGSDQYHPYQSLDISAQVLLWTTELESSLETLQDVVLVSDCTHFQQFHCALAITMLRSLRNGGIALFCQPKRGDSLENFIVLLESASGLVRIEWVSHPAIEQAHIHAAEQHGRIYDENLHYPKILVVTKLREMTNEDREGFVLEQKKRDLQK